MIGKCSFGLLKVKGNNEDRSKFSEQLEIREDEYHNTLSKSNSQNKETMNNARTMILAFLQKR
jgi:phage protein U